MVKKQLTTTLLLPLLALAATSCVAPEKEATVLYVTVPAINVSAVDTHLDAIVTCDAKWTVTLDDESWARIESTEANSQGGIFRIVFGPNASEDSRRVGLVTKSGEKVFSLVITQGGASSFFSPRKITISGAESGFTRFTTPSAWSAEVTEGKDWLTLKTTSGSAGIVNLECVPADANENVGARTANIKVHIGDIAFDVPVTQGQKDVIYLEPGTNIDMPYEGGEFSVLTKSNVNYSIACSDRWVQHATTKALNEATEQFTVNRNPGADTRVASIAFRAEGILTTITVTQEGHDPILDIYTPTLSGIFGYSCEFGQDYWNQSLSRTSATGEYSYTFMSSKFLSVYEIAGIDTTAEVGDTFDIKVIRQEKAQRGTERSLTVTVVGADDSLMWLRASENTWLIIEKQQ